MVKGSRVKTIFWINSTQNICQTNTHLRSDLLERIDCIWLFADDSIPLRERLLYPIPHPILRPLEVRGRVDQIPTLFKNVDNWKEWNEATRVFFPLRWISPSHNLIYKRRSPCLHRRRHACELRCVWRGPEGRAPKAAESWMNWRRKMEIVQPEVTEDGRPALEETSD